MSLEVAQGSGERFVDGLAFEFADPESGTFALCDVALRPDARQASVLSALFDGDRALGTASAARELDAPTEWTGIELEGASVAADERGATVRAGGEGWSVEAELEAAGEPVRFDTSTEAAATIGADVEVVGCRVRASASGGQGDRNVECWGTMRRLTGTVDSPNLSLIRALAVPFEDGSLLALSAARPARAEGHGQEGVTAFLRKQGESTPVLAGAALLSTQYDGEGNHVRAGLELELPLAEDEEAPPLRGAGTRVCGTRFGDAVAAAFFQWELEGRKGIGRYDIVRPG